MEIVSTKKVWRRQRRLYEEYEERVKEVEEIHSDKKGKDKEKKVQIGIKKIRREIKEKQKDDDRSRGFNYKYWNVDTSQFWEEFDLLKTRNEPLNRLFATSADRSAALSLGFMIHSGIRLRQCYVALLQAKPNVLRNQSFLRQLIELDAMKHDLEQPGRRKAVQFRDEYEPFELDEYLKIKEYYRWN